MRVESMRDKQVDLTQVVELPGHLATPEQLSMMLTRYRFARGYCKDREVLEVACGGGTGLGYLSKIARRVVAGDVDPRNLRIARSTYGGFDSIELRELDAHDLPFSAGSFDVVILIDSLYFLSDFELFLRESHRVLRPGGHLIISTVNIHWAEFNPSHYATRYYDGRELTAVLSRAGFTVRQFGAFPASSPGSATTRFVSHVRRVAIKYQLIPTQVRAKELLKRLFYGRLRRISRQVTDEMAQPADLVPIDAANAASNEYKILYFEACKDGPVER